MLSFDTFFYLCYILVTIIVYFSHERKDDFMSISRIQSNSPYTALSSGYKINSAADDAAGLAISAKLLSQSNGYDAGSDNASDSMSLINVADGALSGIQDSLQRIYELGVRASNGLYSDSDKQALQKEIDGIKQNIQGIAQGTSFNTLKLLDGSMADIELATNPQGDKLKIQLVNSTLESLGIADFDVTKDFDLNSIENAMEKVSSARSSFGAQFNSLQHTISNNNYTSYNLTAANSRIKDTDYGDEIIKRNRDEALHQYRIFGIKAQTEQNAGFLKLF